MPVNEAAVRRIHPRFSRLSPEEIRALVAAYLKAAGEPSSERPS